jgi:hypothetical protein
MSCINEGTHHFACACREQYFADLTRRMNDLEGLMKVIARGLQQRIDHDVMEKAIHDSLQQINIVPSQYHL